MSYWGIRLGRGGQYADTARSGGFIAIGWSTMGDLAWLTTSTDDDHVAREKLFEAYEGAYGHSGMKASGAVGQIWRFVREMAPGDIVLVPHVSKGVVHVGRIRSEFEFVSQPPDACPYLYRRGVDWLNDYPRRTLPGKLASSLNSMLTLFSLANRSAEVRAVVTGDPLEAAATERALSVVEHAIDRLVSMHPKEFEAFVAAYFRAIGYDAQPTPYSGDGGIDVAGLLDAEGLTSVQLRVQVKRTQSTVGIETVLKTRGALGIDEQGAIISLGGFTSQAREEAESEGKKTIVLVEGETFVDMLLDHWDDLGDAARALLGVRPKEPLPVRERFEVGPVGS